TSSPATRGIVILLGSVSKNLNPGDERLNNILLLIADCLNTSSESVQFAASQCLIPLVKNIKNESINLLSLLLNKLKDEQEYFIKRGCAYGISSIVKGLGISCLKELNVLNELKLAIESKNSEHRQGALIAYEMLSKTLGRLFEPFISQILTNLLLAFGDSNIQVRNTAQLTSRIIMSNLSSHCVKIILPFLLNGLKESQWRSKKASVELLGQMAFLAPKQLSINLPIIIPEIANVLNDSHINVQEAAKKALENFTSVIRNPEIQTLGPILLKGLSDPNNQTETSLKALMETTFIHYIDPPSLALLIPIIQRGLKERSAEIKKKAAHIVSNMCTLTEKNDFVLYLPQIVP
ncbi:ARM repeat-containing protein, partial [Rozella allomycis CSF55]